MALSNFNVINILYFITNFKYMLNYQKYQSTMNTIYNKLKWLYTGDSLIMHKNLSSDFLGKKIE